jgi:hypothetical protein
VRSQIRNHALPARPLHRRFEVLEDDRLRGPVEIDRAAGWQEGEALAHLRLDWLAVAAHDRAEALGEAELPRCWPIRSSTVRWLFPSARRRPRPSCCVKTVAEAVGLSSSSVSRSGTSTPSPSTSTENTHRSRPAARSRNAFWRISGGSSPVSATLSIPASENFRAMAVLSPEERSSSQALAWSFVVRASKATLTSAPRAKRASTARFSVAPMYVVVTTRTRPPREMTPARASRSCRTPDQITNAQIRSSDSALASSARSSEPMFGCPFADDFAPVR